MATTFVDDRDPAIKYSGTWEIQESTSHEEYDHTSHGANPKCSFTYTFTGTQIQVIGMIPACSNCVSQQYQLAIDGGTATTVEATMKAGEQQFNQTLWVSPTLAAAQHTLDFTTLDSDTSIPSFYLDYLLVTSPSPSSSAVESTASSADANPTATSLPPVRSAETSQQLIAASLSGNPASSIAPPSSPLPSLSETIPGPPLPSQSSLSSISTPSPSPTSLLSSQSTSHPLSDLSGSEVQPTQTSDIQHSGLGPVPNTQQQSSGSNSKLHVLLLAIIAPLCVIIIILVVSMALLHRRQTKTRRVHPTISAADVDGQDEHILQDPSSTRASVLSAHSASTQDCDMWSILQPSPQPSEAPSPSVNPFPLSNDAAHTSTGGGNQRADAKRPSPPSYTPSEREPSVVTVADSDEPPPSYRS